MSTPRHILQDKLVCGGRKSPILKGEDATRYRSACMRLSYLARDRLDLAEKVFSVPTVNNTSLRPRPRHQGTFVGTGQYPRYTDALKGRPWVAQKHHKTQTLTRRRNKFVEPLHGSGAGSLRPQIYEATTELGDKNTFGNQPRATGSPAGDPARDSAGELREASRQHVQK